MRRLFRLIIGAVTVLSATLSVAVGVIWVRSYRVGESLGVRPTTVEGHVVDSRSYSVTWVKGRVLVRVSRDQYRISDVVRHRPINQPGTHPTWARWPPSELLGRIDAKQVGWRRPLGFYLYYNYRNVPMPLGRPPGFTRTLVVGAPCWFLAAATAALPATRLARWAGRRRRLRQGRCVHCGYDLRATSDRCPECGRPAPAAAGGPPSPSPAPA